MKKFLCLLLLPLLSLAFLCGCGDDKKSEDLKTLYNDMVEISVIDEDNKFFSSESAPHSIVIKYSQEVEGAINSLSASTDTQKRYKALGLQQKVLNCIYNYYEKNQEDFYKVMSSGNFDKKDMNHLYDNLYDLKTTIENFKIQYKAFMSSTEDGVSDIMEFNLTNYAFELNKVIEKSFDFMYNFHDLYTRYCIEDYNEITEKNLEIKIEKSYLDIAYIVYLENFKSFNFSVGNKGICDLVAIVGNNNEYCLIDNIDEVKKLSTAISTNLNPESLNYNSANAIINKYLYAQEVFDQRYLNYIKIYDQQNIYYLTQYKFELVTGVSYDSYIKSMSASDRALVTSLRDFVQLYFNDLVEKLDLMTE